MVIKFIHEGELLSCLRIDRSLWSLTVGNRRTILQKNCFVSVKRRQRQGNTASGDVRLPLDPLGAQTPTVAPTLLPEIILALSVK